MGDQCHSRAVTLDSTKFDYLVAALDNRTAAEVESIVCPLPQQDKYVALKQLSFLRLGKSQAQKDNELFSIGGLGDKSFKSV